MMPRQHIHISIFIIFNGLVSSMHIPPKSLIRQKYPEDFEPTSSEVDSRYIHDVLFAYPAEGAHLPRKDYSHLEPPLALPSRQQAPKKDHMITKLDTDEAETGDFELFNSYNSDYDSDEEENEYDDSGLFSREKKMDSTSRSSSEDYEKEPEAVYLPVDNKEGNLLYNSLVDMINVAENMKVKRNDPKDYYNDEADDEDVEELVFDDSIKTDGAAKKSHENMMYPQVARVQDRTNEDSIDGDEWSLPKMEWDPADTPVATAVLGSVMLFLISFIVVLALRVHCRNRSRKSKEWVRHSSVSSGNSSGIIQPTLHHPQTETIRIKSKGLLERRGSNTSLTLELGSEPPENFVIRKECAAEEYLMTASKRLSRSSLRDVFKTPKLLHDEFWSIPPNIPEKDPIPGTSNKNRYRSVLPNRETRVILRGNKGDAHPSDHYINANYIRGYDCEERAYIGAQGPLTHTAGDMWRMIIQEKARAIVMITKLKEKGRIKCDPYIPAYSAKYDDIQVTVKKVIEKSGYTIRHMVLKRGEETHSTLHFWFTSWPDHKTPASARHLLAMTAEVHATKKDGDGPVVVHCSAGIGRTGCFIAVSVGVRQLLEEGAVDVLAIVCQMRLDRGGMVQTPEQYEFIHRALALYEATLPVSSFDGLD